MIFVTVGSQKFPFERLLKQVDRMVESRIITEEVVAQAGHSGYIPRFCRCRAFYDRDAFGALLERCDVLITHGGAGTMVEAVKRGKKVIAVPRLARYGEHVDDHQLELTQRFHKMGLVCACPEVERLAEALQWVQDYRPAPFRSNTEAFLASLDAFLNAL
ncbi:MAG: beta(1,3)galactosyltransferase EpsH [Anaerotruncus sp.]|jgi:UDP-N-acetylglucosamine transferase subunit ALG13|nr:beta(1,3)galactosyltransferase EpsH [Anaerotruncus sp.]